MNRMLLCALMAMLAMTLAAKMQEIELTARDLGGNPIQDAQVVVSVDEFPLLSWTKPPKCRKYEYKTDADGNVKCRFRCPNGDFSLWLYREGYYDERFSLLRGNSDGRATSFEVVMLRKQKPIPMFSWWGCDPVRQKWTNGIERAGFDLVKNDFMRPNGKGEVADFTIVREMAEVNGEKKCRFMLEFSEADGCYVVKSSFTDIGGRRRGLVYSANTNAHYVSKIELKPVDENATTRIAVDEGDCLVMRTRTVRDKNGDIVACNYSKIYGPIYIARGSLFVFGQSCFNPNDKDANLEFDLRNNLTKRRMGGIHGP